MPILEGVDNYDKIILRNTGSEHTEIIQVIKMGRK